MKPQSQKNNNRLDANELSVGFLGRVDGFLWKTYDMQMRVR